MVRGCQKKIIYLKNTGSEVFEEAYFVVREKNLAYESSECDMIEEANRILDECTSFDEKSGRLTKIKKVAINKILPFFIGTVIGILSVLIIK